MTNSTLHQRLAEAAGARTYRRLGELTGTHPETVRRYMQGQAPSAEFLSGVCRALGLNGSWLLTGQGPMLLQDVRSDALVQADAADLLTAISGTLTQLIDRVGRLERSVQTLDSRLRACGAPIGADGQPEMKPEQRKATRRAVRVGDAVVERAPADDD